MRRTHSIAAGFENGERGPSAREHGCRLGAQREPQSTASTETFVRNHIELNLAHNFYELESELPSGQATS